MFIIRDCNGALVGRKQGYKKHSTAVGLTMRFCGVRRAIYDAFHSKTNKTNPHLLYSIRWED